MTPEERQLVTGLFDRMRSYSVPEKDAEAEALISERVRAVPDSPYMLVQSVLVQEQALEQADSRIKALEEQVRTLESQQRPAGTGSFLGGLFGSRPAAEASRGPSVPVVGSRATPPVYAGGQPAQSGPFGTQPPPPAQPGVLPGQAAATGGGGFLRTAMATATGVAGGILVAGAIRNLMTPAHAAEATPSAAGATPNVTGSGEAQPAAASASSGETATPEPAHHEEPAHEEPAHADAAEEDSGWFGDGADDLDF